MTIGIHKRPPSQDKFLYPDNAPEVVGYLQHLQEEREKAAQKEADVPEKGTNWIPMHMSIAAKRASINIARLTSESYHLIFGFFHCKSKSCLPIHI